MSGFSTFMAGSGWVLFSLVAAVFSAGMYLTNQYLKQPGHVLVFWSRVLVVIVLSPIIPFFDLPTDWRFYAVLVATVFFGTVADMRTFNVSAKYGGGVVSRVQPLVVWGTFFLWFLFDPALLQKYAAHPFNTAGILLALGGCVFFAQRLNKCAITKAAMIEMLPALFGYTMTMVLNKYAMAHGNLHGAVIGYMYIQSVIAVIVLGPYVAWKEKDLGLKAKNWLTKGMIAAALLMTVSWIGHMIFKNYAMAFTQNPAYQVALNLTTPVFIAAFYFFVKHKEEADVKSGFGVVLCAVLLVLLTVR